jgi:hypothetical protein
MKTMAQENEFEAHYLGGHTMFPDRLPVLMQLCDECLFVALYALGQCLGPPFLSVPYTTISNIQDMPSEIAVPDLIMRKGENYLTLTFKDEFDAEQTVVFKIRKSEKAPSAIGKRVVEAKKKQTLENDT